MNKLLSLDLSTVSSGWAVFQDGHLQEAGKIVAKQKELYDRIGEMRSGVLDLLIFHNPDHIVIESVFSGNNLKTAAILSELQGVIKYLCWENEIPWSNISVSTVRKHFAVRTKKAVFDIIKQDYGDWVKLYNSCNDISDAIAVGKTYLAQ
jgi:Holliday junction resolvasome RuvABC endonuclease subunit